MSKQNTPYPNAALVHASYALFDPGQSLCYKHLQSRVLLWNKSGRGKIKIDEHLFELSADQMVVVPWGHTIQFRADNQDPFMLGGVHIIPNHHEGQSIHHRPLPSETAGASESAARQDCKLCGFEDIVVIALNEHLGLANLLDYCVQLYLMEPPPEWKARQLGQMILSELETVRDLDGSLHREFPLKLLELKRYIRQNIDQPIEVSELLEGSQLSRSTVERLFKKHCTMSPIQWINQQKIIKAKELLQTSGIPVSEVGNRVGIHDAYYFSKLFKKYTGQSPRKFRQLSSWI